MTTTDRRLLLYPLLGIAATMAAGLLIARQQPEIGIVTLLLQYLVPPLAAVVYAACAQRVSVRMKKAGDMDADRLLLFSLIPVMFVTCVLYPLMVYNLLRGEDLLAVSAAPTREYRFYSEDEAFSTYAFGQREPVERTIAMNAIREFNGKVGFVCHAEPRIEGWIVQMGGQQRYSSLAAPYGNYVVDPQRRQVRRFAYEKSEYYGETEPVPTPLAAEALAERMQQCAALLHIPAAAVPVDVSDTAGDAVLRLSPEQLDLATPHSARTLAWRREYRGIPYLFNRIQMTFDPAGRLVFYTNDWTDSVPSDMTVRLPRVQALAIGGEHLRTKLKETGVAELKVTDTWCALAIVQAVQEKERARPSVFRYFDYQRYGPYVLAWVVKFRVVGSGNYCSGSSDYEYVLVNAANGEDVGCIDETWRMRLN